MSKRHYLIDPGHGGLINDVYQTAPDWSPDNPESWKKMWVHDGVPIFEGVFNRMLSKELCSLLSDACIDYTLIVPEEEDISLAERCKRINDIYDSYSGSGNPYVGISIHGNASGVVRTAHGDEIWTSKGETESDRLATEFAKEYVNTTGRRFRADYSDGDPDKEANFWILKHTKCPMMLTENGFFDNPDEAAFMMTDGVELFAAAHLAGIRAIENYTYSF